MLTLNSADLNFEPTYRVVGFVAYFSSLKKSSTEVVCFAGIVSTLPNTVKEFIPSNP